VGPGLNVWAARRLVVTRQHSRKRGWTTVTMLSLSLTVSQQYCSVAYRKHTVSPSFRRPRLFHLQLSGGEHTSLVTAGKLDVLVDERTVQLPVTPRALLGEILVAASDIPLLLPVSYLRGSSERESVFSRLTDDPVVDGPVDTGVVTLEMYRQQVFTQTADFYVVRIDLSGKGIRIMSGQSAGGAGTARYPSAYVDSLKPLALMNATPFNMTSYLMSGSVQDQGTPVSYSGTYISTIGIDRDNTPFYIEGTAHAVVRLDSGKNLLWLASTRRLLHPARRCFLCTQTTISAACRSSLPRRWL